jgi:hypothetical protein
MRKIAIEPIGVLESAFQTANISGVLRVRGSGGTPLTIIACVTTEVPSPAKRRGHDPQQSRW